jgi:hypothetical protein
MPLYLKKVDAIQFNLNDEQKELIKSRKVVYFEGSPVKHVGGEQYIALLQQGENLLKVQSSQWLVRHPDGLWQILWPDQFAANFIKGSDAEALNISHDPFKAKTFNQPNTLL